MSRFSPQVQSNWGETFSRALGQGVGSFVTARRQRDLDDRQKDEDALALYHQGLREQTDAERTAVPNAAAVNTHLAAALNPTVGVAAPAVRPEYAGADFAQALQAPVHIGSRNYVQTDAAKRADQIALEDRAALLQDRNLGQSLKRSEIAKNSAQATKDLRPTDPRAPLLGSPEWRAAQEFSANLGRTSHQADRQYDIDHPTRDQQAPKATDGQRQVAGLIPEITTAATRLDTMTPDLLSQHLGHLPIVGNYAKTQEGRQFMQTASQFITNTVYAKSGKGVTGEEFKRLWDEFIPQNGDDDTTLKQKKNARDLFVSGVYDMAGSASSVRSAPAAPTDGPRRAPLAPRGGVQPQRGAAPVGDVNLGAPTPAQALWDAAVAKHGKAKVLQEFGDRP